MKLLLLLALFLHSLAINYVQDASVENILDTSISQLLMDKNRKFIYVEMAFFTKWWNKQSESVKEKVTRLAPSTLDDTYQFISFRFMN